MLKNYITDQSLIYLIGEELQLIEKNKINKLKKKMGARYEQAVQRKID